MAELINKAMVLLLAVASFMVLACSDTKQEGKRTTAKRKDENPFSKPVTSGSPAQSIGEENEQKHQGKTDKEEHQAKLDLSCNILVPNCIEHLMWKIPALGINNNNRDHLWTTGGNGWRCPDNPHTVIEITEETKQREVSIQSYENPLPHTLRPDIKVLKYPSKVLIARLPEKWESGVEFELSSGGQKRKFKIERQYISYRSCWIDEPEETRRLQGLFDNELKLVFHWDDFKPTDQEMIQWQDLEKKLGKKLIRERFYQFRIIVLANKANPLKSLSVEELHGHLDQWHTISESSRSRYRELLNNEHLKPSYPGGDEKVSYYLIECEAMNWLSTAINDIAHLEPNTSTLIKSETSWEGNKNTRFCRSYRDLTSKIANDKHGIGFCFYNPDIDKYLEDVKVLAISKYRYSVPIKPVLKPVFQSEQYPFQRTVYLYMRPDAPDDAKAIYRILKSPETARILMKHGIITQTGK